MIVGVECASVPRQALVVLVLRPHDLTLMALAAYLTVIYGLKFGFAVVLAVLLGDELDNYF